MRLILPYFLIFIAWLAYKLKKSERTRNDKSISFWENERTANLTRRKNIDNLDYITIPINSLPFFETNDTSIQRCQDTILALSEKKILNLTGLSNTDLKLKYGTANLPLLSSYDDNYSTLVNTLSQWGNSLMKAGFVEEAVRVLEFGIECNTDVSNNYYLLYDYYKAENKYDKINNLISHANSINSLSKDRILNKLNA